MRAIDADALMEAINSWPKFGVDERCRIVPWDEGYEPYIHLRDAVIAITGMPTIEERKKGKWNFIGDQMFECTECGTCYTQSQFYQMRVRISDTEFPKFCPNCGADMRGDGDA